MSISRSVAAQTGQRLDANQELIGQGLANAGCGVFSGYAGSGSFTRTAVALKAGAQTQMSAVFTGLFVLLAVVALAPAAASVPKAALAGVLIVTAYNMVDRKEIARIWHGTRGDAIIMVATFVATLFLPIEFAVLAGILVSFALYIKRTSEPRVVSVLPDRRYRRLYHQPHKPPCPQLAILDVEGDFYFGAVTQVEEAIARHLKENPEQRYLLLRMHSVNQCDYSGIHCLEGIVRSVRELGGDVFLTRVHRDVDHVMRSTGFRQFLGEDQYILETAAISQLFHKVLDPAICIYECDVRAFRECQNLPKRPLPLKIGLLPGAPATDVPTVSPAALWKRLHGLDPPVVVDVREPREYRRGHIPGSTLVPLPKLVGPDSERPRGPVVFVCRSGRRSSRAAAYFIDKEGGDGEISVLKGGMRAWEAAKLLVAIDSWRHTSQQRAVETPDEREKPPDDKKETSGPE
jgi:SulP family sulfate permease